MWCFSLVCFPSPPLRPSASPITDDIDEQRRRRSITPQLKLHPTHTFCSPRGSLFDSLGWRWSHCFPLFRRDIHYFFTVSAFLIRRQDSCHARHDFFLLTSLLILVFLGLVPIPSTLSTPASTLPLPHTEIIFLCLGFSSSFEPFIRRVSISGLFIFGLGWVV
ncbi:hypothetical protein VTJ04DRAFT_9637 [Mycothermus thermophilus]|uniref:uncharacterized protein n=1 Tax=Humicola insolens TaxID=85995 RepID=UPI0037426F05